ncbi:hypothetical protein BDY19DRAFT_997054 [Irpex rosettiformis]|uniref:Uncharacterized protein n=1 Tax=Irpex rosettiformis TaxID=378272 RepID=A0ACB8TTH7_9APHY|nr:hypothetical protein BDY19DRAFT_997054 [Irpex rosettiformis]
MLLSLPEEILVQILKILNASDRNARCRLVNQKLKSVIDSNIVLQASTECELANMTLGKSNRITLPDLLASLEERQNAWRTLRGLEEHSLPVYDENESILPMLGGDCSILCQTTSSGQLVLTQIPSKTRDIPFKTWTLDVETDQLSDAAADARQDLLATASVTSDDINRITGVELQLLSIMTGAAHPAAQGVIPLADDLIGIMMCILRNGQCDDVLVNHHWIYNWKTGEVKVEAWCGNDDQISNSTSFAFLSPEHVLIARFDWPSFRRVELIVVNTRNPNRRGTFATIADAIFDLPELEPNAKCCHILIKKHAVPLNTAFNTRDCAFTHKQESRVISIDLLYTGSRGLHYQYRLAIPAVAMLRCLSETFTAHPVVQEPSTDASGIETIQPTAQDASHIPWRDWEREVRWVPVKRSLLFHSSTSQWLILETRTPYELKGHRSPIHGHTRALFVLVKYDFPTDNQMRRESALPPPPFDPSGPLILIEVNYCKREAVLADDLWAYQVNSAPYRQTIFTTNVASVFRHFTLSYDITEDALVLRNTEEP